MNRLRIGFSITALLGITYAAVSLLDSLTGVGVGLAVAAAAVIGYGLIEFIEEH